MLRELLDPARWDVEVVGYERLSAELLNLAAEQRPAVICIGALPPGGMSHTRYLCKRLRARFPDVKILVGRWGLKGHLERNQQQLREAGADQVVTTLREARDVLGGWLPVLAERSEPAPSLAAKSTRTTD
jgi:DNA-binding transcriptional LysR family regulator